MVGRRRRGRQIGILALLIAMTISLAAPAEAEEAYIVENETSITLDKIYETADYLRTEYPGISDQEILRRAYAQLDSHTLQENLRRDFPNEFAGMWMDQANGGIVRVLSTNPGKMHDALSRVPDRLKSQPQCCPTLGTRTDRNCISNAHGIARLSSSDKRKHGQLDHP